MVDFWSESIVLDAEPVSRRRCAEVLMADGWSLEEILEQFREGKCEFAKGNPDDWQPYVITKGKRKGQSVWKNAKTGVLRDEPPGGKGKGGEDVTGDSGKKDKVDTATATQTPKTKKDADSKPSESGPPNGTRRPFGPTDVRPFQTPPETEKVLFPKAKDWQAGLSEKEKIAFRFYANEGHKALNYAMRHCPSNLDCLSPSDRKLAKSLSESIEKAPKLDTPITTWRGIDIKDSKKMAMMENGLKAALQTGGVVSLAGFTSTSTKPSIAADWGGTSVVIELRHRYSSYLGNGIGVSHEREVLLPHNTQWKVTSYTEKAPFDIREKEPGLRRVYVLEAVENEPETKTGKAAKEPAGKADGEQNKTPSGTDQSSQAAAKPPLEAKPSPYPVAIPVDPKAQYPQAIPVDQKSAMNDKNVEATQSLASRVLKGVATGINIGANALYMLSKPFSSIVGIMTADLAKMATDDVDRLSQRYGATAAHLICATGTALAAATPVVSHLVQFTHAGRWISQLPAVAAAEATMRIASGTKALAGLAKSGFTNVLAGIKSSLFPGGQKAAFTLASTCSIRGVFFGDELGDDELGDDNALGATMPEIVSGDDNDGQNDDPEQESITPRIIRKEAKAFADRLMQAFQDKLHDEPELIDALRIIGMVH